MKKEKSLVKVKEGKFTKFLNKIKMFIFRKNKKDIVKEKNEKQEVQKESVKSPIDDMETLRKILSNEIQIKDLDNDTKRRLIALCNKRELEIKEKIKETKEKITTAERIMQKLS